MIQSYFNSAEKQRSVQLQPREPQEESGKAEREKKNDSLLPVKLRLKIAYQQAVQNYNLHFLAIDHRQIYIEIVEPPASNKMRFRYECEGRSAGAIQGASSTPQHRTCPTIRLVGYKGPTRVIVSCVEENDPHRAHPHNLVGKKCIKGICMTDMNEDTMTATFPSIGVQCVKRKDIPSSLAQREKNGVDPFQKGFDHKNSVTSINLNSLRLCFQVFPKSQHLLHVRPIVSAVIRDKKVYRDLSILKMSENWAPAEGGKTILLFCSKISRHDIEVHFKYISQGRAPIVMKSSVTAADVHEQAGISLITPPFYDRSIRDIAQAYIYLFKPSEGIQSEPLEFFFHPSLMKPSTRDNSSQTMDMPSSPMTFVNSLSSERTLQPSTLNRRLKRSLMISDEHSTKAKLRTNLEQINVNQIKIEPLEDSGFCDSVNMGPPYPIDAAFVVPPSMPTILLENRNP